MGLPAVIAGAGAIADATFKFAPQLEDEVTVEVVGQPGASKKQLYFLALAAAFGIVKRADVRVAGKFLQPPPGMLMIEYDAADHWVRCTLRYKTSLLQGAAAGLIGNVVGTDIVGPGIANLSSIPLYAGPKCDVIGGEFEFVGQVPVAAAGIPDSSDDPLAPKLPFKDKTILTVCAQVKDPNPAQPGSGGNVIDSPNPKPPGDNRSRGAVVTGGAARPTGFVAAVSNLGSLGQDDCCLNKSMSLVPLVFAALSDPGSFRGEVFAEQTSGPLGK